ncbi:MAG: 4Fe-4S binding protein, partial [Clostridia bacterium]|nr:4Fe-4S binding protein [Clostridia bacterium]
MKKFFSKLKGWWQRHKPSKRRLIQLYTALLYNANIKGFFQGGGGIYKGNTKALCLPGMNCYSCPGAIGACPLGSLQNALMNSDTKAGAYVFGILILFGLLIGRTMCGFLCPVGLLQELIYKIKTPKLKKSKVTRGLSYLKYVILVVLVVAVPLIYSGVMASVPAFCKYICPAGTAEGAIALLSNPDNSASFGQLGYLFTWKMSVLIVIVVACIFVYRAFCRFLCPLGAFYGFFSKLALLGVKLDKNKCTDCGLCISVCKMDVKKVGDHECIQCGECISVCPSKA